jgi:disulfide bond formation protein DsbB
VQLQVGFDFPLLVYPHLGARLIEEGVMGWFTVTWWRWRLAQARGRNPLVRTSDRIEVAVMALAVAFSLFSLPIAGAIGTAVHEDRAHVYAEQQHDRHRVAATATADSTSSPKGPVTVAARWQLGDVENAGALTSDTPVNEGSSVDIWVDRNGRHVSAPAPSWQAGVDAVGAAMAFWLSVAAAAALVVALVRRLLRRTRYAGWNRDIANLVHDDGGRTNRRR